MALKNMDVGVKALVGLTLFALVMAMLSDGDPDNDAWGGGDAASATSEGDAPALLTDPDDAWSATPPEEGGALPACDATAPFPGDGVTFRLPVDGPIVPFASPACSMSASQGGAGAVQLLQQALAQCNGQQIAIDGRYGADTRAAVRAIQAQRGIRVDGAYGPETRDVLAWPTGPAAGDAAQPTCARHPDPD